MNTRLANLFSIVFATAWMILYCIKGNENYLIMSSIWAAASFIIASKR